MSTVLTLPFEGEPLTTLTWKDRPAWVAREIGRRVGYSDGGKRLVSRIRREWADEFIEGTDYVVLAGDELASLKHLLGPDSAAVSSHTSGLVLLLEPGLHLVLTKTEKPVGKRLRRFLVDEVLPQLVRGQSVRAALREAHTVSPDAVRWFREQRLARRVDLDDRRFQVDVLRRCITLLRVLGHLDDWAYVRWEVRLAEMALGRRLDLIPSDDDPAPAACLQECSPRAAA